jgi:hypothetical protein
VTVPASAGGRLPICIGVGGARSKPDNDAVLQCAPPEILSCTAVGNPGDGMSIKGQNFGSTVGQDCQVKVGNYVSDVAKVVVSHTRIDCRIPEPIGRDRKNLLVRVYISGQWSEASLSALFTYKGEEPGLAFSVGSEVVAVVVLLSSAVGISRVLFATIKG